MSRTRTFPLANCSWTDYAGRPELRSADDGPPGYGGWHYPRSAWHLHRGIDLAARVGQPVLAVEDGVAEYRSITVGIGPDGFNAAGHRVLLHGYSGAVYRYLHLGTNERNTGDAFPPGVLTGDKIEVETGRVLGFAGFTGGSQATGVRLTAERCHLHFAWQPEGLGGPYANPALLFEAMLRDA